MTDTKLHISSHETVNTHHLVRLLCHPSDLIHNFSLNILFRKFSNYNTVFFLLKCQCRIKFSCYIKTLLLYLFLFSIFQYEIIDW